MKNTVIAVTLIALLMSKIVKKNPSRIHTHTQNNTQNTNYPSQIKGIQLKNTFLIKHKNITAKQKDPSSIFLSGTILNTVATAYKATI